MEASTPAVEASTGSKTIADMLARGAERFGDRAAIRYKRDGAWHDVSYAEANEIASEIALGLIDLGIDPGDRVCILANTRPEWSYCDFAASSTGAVVVPIYQTNSPEECQWVAGNSEAKAIICEDASQVAKIVEVREQLPHLETIVAIDATGDIADAIPLDTVRERGRTRDRAELRRRYEAVRPEDPFTFIYTSGTTGPPKGCVLTHANYRAMVDMCEATRTVESDETTYLYLPLAHSYALLIQLLSFDVGAALAYWSGDVKQIIPDLSEVHPTNFPSVPRIFEKIYTLVTSHGEPELIRKAVEVGMKVRQLEETGEEIPAELQAHYDEADERLFKNVRGAFGGRVRQAITGAAPIAREILEFFYAAGVPVFEGYGMTETATAATFQSHDQHKFGTVGKPFPGVEVKIAEDGELLIKGDNVFGGYYKNADESFGAVRDGWLHTGDLGSIDDEGFVSITGRKKDIIITAGGKNLTPANIENDLKQSRWISQAVMYGDRRPFPVALVTLDEEEIVPWAQAEGLPGDVASLSREPKVHELIQGVLDGINDKYAQVEQVKKFTILDHDLMQETGELTPTMKVKRNVVNEKYAELFDALYSG
jgi:long-chain acyl-CoA synthetase